MNVLVAGGAGYIGSVVTQQLIETGHTVTIYDNLSKGHRRAPPDQAQVDVYRQVGTLPLFQS